MRDQLRGATPTRRRRAASRSHRRPELPSFDGLEVPCRAPIERPCANAVDFVLLPAPRARRCAAASLVAARAGDVVAEPAPRGAQRARDRRSAAAERDPRPARPRAAARSSARLTAAVDAAHDRDGARRVLRSHLARRHRVLEADRAAGTHRPASHTGRSARTCSGRRRASIRRGRSSSGWQSRSTGRTSSRPRWREIGVSAVHFVAAPGDVTAAPRDDHHRPISASAASRRPGYA